MRAADLESDLYVKIWVSDGHTKDFPSPLHAIPKTSKFLVPCKLYAADAIQTTFQVKCMPQAKYKRLAVEHKTWKVICMAKSTGTTEANMKLPSPLHAIPKTSKLLARFQVICSSDPVKFVCKLWGGPLKKFKFHGWRTIQIKRAFKWCIAT